MKRFLPSFTMLLLAAVALIGIGAVAWFQRATFFQWHYLRGLSSANAADRDAWIRGIVQLESEAVPGLLEMLKSPNKSVCDNAQAALVELARHWGYGDERTVDLAEQLRELFSTVTEPGQLAILDWHIAVFTEADDETASNLWKQSEAFFKIAALRLEPAVRSRTLAMANLLLDHQPSVSNIANCSELVKRELRATEPTHCLEAIRLTMHDTLQHSTDLLKEVVPLLRHADAKVRHAALLAVSTTKEVVSEDELLPLLHDPDVRIRGLCESTLKSRGLTDAQIHLGKLISNRDPKGRVRVFLYLEEVQDIDHGLWIKRLSQDEDEAIRAAAARMAGVLLAKSQQTGIRQISANMPEVYASMDLRDRLAEMARNDASPTVRQVAEYYLRQCER